MVRDYVKKAARAYQQKDISSAKYYVFQAEWEVFILNNFYSDSDLKAIKVITRRITNVR